MGEDIFLKESTNLTGIKSGEEVCSNSQILIRFAGALCFYKCVSGRTADGLSYTQSSRLKRPSCSTRYLAVPPETRRLPAQFAHSAVMAELCCLIYITSWGSSSL